ncbi:MAG: AAA family ATPase [Bryobacteraceae bacterium]
MTKKHPDMHAISPRNQPASRSDLQRNRRNSARLKALIVTVGNVKGGVGKTTLAVNLAISQALRNKDVLLVDGDEQGTARAFTQLRAEELGEPATRQFLFMEPRSERSFSSLGTNTRPSLST